jgi:hypothetical protein
LLEEARTVARRHWLFLTVLAIGSILRILSSIAYQPGFFGGGDSLGYIDVSEKLRPTGYRPIGYPIFLWMLSFTKSIAVVTMSQHVLAVAAAAGLYVLLLRFGLSPIWSAIGVTPFLLDAYQIDRELFILADLLGEVLVVAGLIVLVWRRRPSVVQVVVAGLLLAAAGVTRTTALVILPLALLYLLVVRAGWVRVVAFVSAVAGLLFAYAGWYDATNHQFTLQSDSGFFLYGRVAPFANCHGLSLPPIEQKLCQNTPPATRPGAGFYLWNPQSPLRRYIPVWEWYKVTKDFDERIIAHQPLTYLSTGTEDTLHYFAPGHPIGRLDWPIQASQFPGRHIGGRAWALFMATTGYRGERVVPKVVSPAATVLRDYQTFGFTQGPILGACLVLAMGAGIGLIGRKRRPGRDRAPLHDFRHERATALLFALCGLATIAFASFTVEFDYRYGLFLIPLLPPAGILAAATILPDAWIQRLRLIAAPTAPSQPNGSMLMRSDVPAPESVGPGPLAPPISPLRRAWGHLPSAVRRTVVRVMSSEQIRLALLDMLGIRKKSGFFPLSNGGPGAIDEVMDRLRAGGPAGDYYEFGLYRGYTFWYAQQAANRVGLSGMRFFGFDSFAGLPEVEGEDGQAAIFIPGDYACTKAEVERQVTEHGFDWTRAALTEGYFDASLTPETKRALGAGPAALVMVDCDLYQSTVPVLAFIADRLQDGTVVLFDDWYCFGGAADRGEPRAFREFLQRHPEWKAKPLMDFPAYGRAFVMRRNGSSEVS